ncbi:hypothetical protein FCK90_10545 [Kocuria coralli]|uniref:DUF4913 domain-containing protein n=1 Tax=Kocuria coralli TaxID=1461025 RepID=A0A5J5KWG1_9MICC|nr:hypothetical protein [Kocuria coralli]KAA9393842.1 hypothetical protein FCK90_10545 [Kocuria coralli]
MSDMVEGPGPEPGEDVLGVDAGSLWGTEPPPDDEETAPPPYEDPAVAGLAAQTEGPEALLATRWRDVKAEDAPTAWVFLRGWVDWLVFAHKIPEKEIPRCWYRHTEIVEELWAAAAAEHQAWEATTASMNPMTAWHFHLSMMRTRLEGKAQECVANKKHIPDEAYSQTHAPGALLVDEADWAKHLATVTDVQPVLPVADGQDVSWRMAVVDDEGLVVTSEGLHPAAVAATTMVTVSAPRILGRDETDGAVLLAGEATAGQRIQETWWEYSADGISWHRVETSRQSHTRGHAAKQ